MFEHQHPLSLKDLQQEDPDYEEDDDENDDLTTKEDFRGQCDRCDQEINWFHRYYYKCDQCDYSIHKFCAELPATLEHVSHVAHPLILLRREPRWRCNICRRHHKPHDIRYHCSQCDFDIDVQCALKWLKTNIIHHPSHMHPLVPITKQILCECDACGKEHKGIFYQCNTCSNSFINHECAFLSKKLLIHHTTNGLFYHTHPLALAYSFPREDHPAESIIRCRVCGKSFDYKLWIYKCDKCRYYAHLDCATSRGELFKLFKSIFAYPGVAIAIKNYAEADHPDLLHLPFPNQTYSILKHIFFENFASYEVTPRHMSHQHPLILVDITKPASFKVKQPLSCHNPMKKIELLCNGCLRPITEMPFYKCEQQSCNFVLHEWCTRLPAQVQTHPGHPQHTLVLLPNAPEYFGVFKCAICKLCCNGFVYSCVQCQYNIDVSCAFIPEKIVHAAHPNHLLWRVQSKPNRKDCASCLRHFGENEFLFSCHTCDFNLHIPCALLLPQTIRHKFDKHPMKLSYFPIENHKSQYFCEVCEIEFAPEYWFYHCYECAYSIHSACSPVILECERACRDYYHPAIYKFLNLKFGGIHNIEDHPHPLSFAQGMVGDGRCQKCRNSVAFEMIFKCRLCKFAIHFTCCEPGLEKKFSEGSGGGCNIM